MTIENRCGTWRALLLLLVWVLLLSSSTFAQQSLGDVDRAFEQATALHQSGDLEGAIKAYQAILKSFPARADVRSNLGAALSRLGRYEEAIEQYTRALALIPDNQTIRFNLAMAYYKAAMFTEAAPELTRYVNATSRSSDSLNAKIVLADCLVRLGEYKRVIELLSPVADEDQTNRTVAYLLGSALIGDNQLDRGQQIIDRLFRDENSAEARLLMGSILLLADDAQKALTEVERAIELNPKLPAVQATYGRVLMRLGDTEKAKDAFKRELASNSNDFDANLYLGILLRQDKQVDEAQSHLTQAIRLRPRDQYARYHLAAVYAMAGKPADARVLLEGVLKEHGDFVEARVLLASVYYRLNLKQEGDREKAIIQKLNADEQAKQPGSQAPADQNAVRKPASTPANPTKSPR